MVKNVEHKIDKKILAMVLILTTTWGVILPAANIALAQATLKHQQQNIQTAQKNILGAIYRGQMLSHEEQIVMIRKTATMIAAQVNGAKVRDFGGAYIIETPTTLIMLGHGKDGRIVAEKQFNVETLAKGKQTVVLGYCGSNDHPYKLSVNTRVLTYDTFAYLPQIVGDVRTLFRLKQDQVLTELSTILKLDERTTELVMTLLTTPNPEKTVKHIITHKTFKLSPQGVLFTLSDGNIPLLEQGPIVDSQCSSSNTANSKTTYTESDLKSNKYLVEPYMSGWELTYNLIALIVWGFSTLFGCFKPTEGVDSVKEQIIIQYILVPVLNGGVTLLLIDAIGILIGEITGKTTFSLTVLAANLINYASSVLPIIGAIINLILTAIMDMPPHGWLVLFGATLIGGIASAIASILTGSISIVIKILAAIAGFACVLLGWLRDAYDLNRYVG
ncbi:MAG: hypothetical protein ACTSQE_13965 [Candidatus Heimdallarchaeaceae archaeon]